jgi:glycosyltransferase involved in cell wall biosynthesis
LNILFVVNNCKVFEIRCGGDIRNNLFAKALSELGHVDVISFYNDSEESNIPGCDVIFSKEMDCSFSNFGGIRSLFCSTLWPENPYSYFQVDKKKEGIIDSFVKASKYDIIVCRYVVTAIRLGLQKYKERLIIDADDNLANVMKYEATRASSYYKRWKLLYKASRIDKMMNKLLNGVLLSFGPNKSELSSPKTIYLHNTSVIDSESSYSPMPNRILFVGKLDFYPNQHGITHFVEAIFPLIRHKNPNALLRIVGIGEPDFLAYLNGIEGVEAVGRVDDLTKEYQEAAVVVIPIYYGAGASIKFIEAMLMNSPIVSTPTGSRGFSEICQDCVHYLEAANDEEFANKTIELLSSVAKAKEIAHNGYEIALQHYSQEKFIEIVKKSITELEL